MISRNVGNCLTEYKLENFDTEVKKYSKFVNVSQFVYNTPKTYAEVMNLVANLPEWTTSYKLFNEPKLMCGYFLFGKAEDGSLVELGSIIDSSD